MTDIIADMSNVPGHGFSDDDMMLCGRVADKLNNHYPGHLWATHLNSDKLGGILVIRNMAQSTRYGYVLHLSTIYADPDLKCVMRAGGEMLERAKMSHEWDGEMAQHVEGIDAKEQPFNGIII